MIILNSELNKMFSDKEVRVLMILVNRPEHTIDMTSLTRRLNVNAGVKSAEKNEILDCLREQGLISVESARRLPGMRKPPTMVSLTDSGRECAEKLMSGDIGYDV